MLKFCFNIIIRIYKNVIRMNKSSFSRWNISTKFRPTRWSHRYSYCCLLCPDLQLLSCRTHASDQHLILRSCQRVRYSWYMLTHDLVKLVSGGTPLCERSINWTRLHWQWGRGMGTICIFTSIKSRQKGRVILCYIIWYHRAVESLNPIGHGVL